MPVTPRALFVALVDLSAPAADPDDGAGGPAAALDRARLFLDLLFDSLAAYAAAGELPCEFDVAAVGYRRTADGPAEVPLLPTAPKTAVSLAGLFAAELPPRGEGEPRRWLADVPLEGEPAPDAGWTAAYRLLTRWLADHPRGRPPVIVHCVREEPTEPTTAERGTRAIRHPDAPAVVFTHRLAADVESLAAELPIAAVWDLLFAEPPDQPEPTAEPPPAPPFEVVREFHCQKIGNDPAQWEDGFAIDPAGGRVAIADGASEGIYCRVWADLLSRGFVTEAPDPARFATWVGATRVGWRRHIDYPKLNWSKQGKVDSTGAAATLLGLTLGPLTDRGERAWQATAVGDACLFWVRDGRPLVTFPLACGEQLGSAPDLLRTLTGRREPYPLTAGGVCRPGDLFLLATDAVAGHLFRLAETGQPLGRYAGVSADEWLAEATELRRNGGMVNDDCTLLVLRVNGVPADEPIPVLEVAGVVDEKPAESTETVAGTDPCETANSDDAYCGA